MKTIASDILQSLWYDLDCETPVRAIITKWTEEDSPPTSDDYIIASYFFALRTKTVSQAATGEGNIALHQRLGNQWRTV